MKYKNLLFIMALLICTFALAACSEKEESDDGQLLAEAAKNVQETTSLSYDMLMEMNMSVMGETIDATINGSIDYIVEPLTMDMKMTADMGSLGTTETSTYAEEVDGNLIMYSLMPDDTTAQPVWYKQSMGDVEALKQYDATASMELYLSSLENFTNAGIEMVNDKEAIKFTGSITGENMEKAVETSGALNQLQGLNLDSATLAQLYESMGDLPITIWIDSAEKMPVKYEMDMTRMMKNLFSILAESSEEMAGASYEVSKMNIVLTVTSYNSIDKIDIPEAAKNAQDLSELVTTGE